MITLYIFILKCDGGLHTITYLLILTITRPNEGPWWQSGYTLTSISEIRVRILVRPQVGKLVVV